VDQEPQVQDIAAHQIQAQIIVLQQEAPAHIQEEEAIVAVAHLAVVPVVLQVEVQVVHLAAVQVVVVDPVTEINNMNISGLNTINI